MQEKEKVEEQSGVISMGNSMQNWLDADTHKNKQLWEGSWVTIIELFL